METILKCKLTRPVATDSAFEYSSEQSLAPTSSTMLALRAKAAARTALRPRLFSSTALRRSDSENVPKPPPPIDDSTSALDYKRIVRTRPPPLPAMDLPRSRTAEEAVTNILYNTPPPSLQPFKTFVSIYFKYYSLALMCLYSQT